MKVVSDLGSLAYNWRVGICELTQSSGSSVVRRSLCGRSASVTNAATSAAPAIVIRKAKLAKRRENE